MEYANRSLWIESTSTSAPRAALKDNRQTDIAVVGGGITGLTTAYLLSRAGLDVTLLEAHRVGWGTTGYTTGKLSALQGLIYDKLQSKFGEGGAAIYAEAHSSAIEHIAGVVEEHDIQCAFERRAAYTYTVDEGGVQKVRGEVEAAKRAGLDVQFTTDTELPFDVAAAVRLDDQAQFQPYRYCVGLAKTLSEAGGAIFEGTRVIGVQSRDDHFELRTDTGAVVQAGKVVIATLLPVLDRGGFFAKASPSRSYLMAFRTPEGSPFQGMYLSSDDPVWTARTYGEWTLLGGQTHRVGEDPDTRRRYQAIEDWAKEKFGLGEPQHRWSSHDYMPLDDVPYVGRMPRSREGMLLATGFRKWGLTGGTAAAMILRDRITGVDNPWAELFSSTRVDVTNSAAKFVSDNVAVAMHFVGDRISNPTRVEVDDLEPGDGGIAEIDGERVAAFVDDSGTLHKLSPVCPHMGCHLTWNSAEKSWDCPCHGSRFGALGDYLQGPAMKDMKKK